MPHFDIAPLPINKNYPAKIGNIFLTFAGFFVNFDSNKLLLTK